MGRSQKAFLVWCDKVMGNACIFHTYIFLIFWIFVTAFIECFHVRFVF